jgi:hypothetical protein
VTDTQTLTLADFLLARIAEDEEFALRYPPTAAARPRALAECEAKRRIVEPWAYGGQEDNWRYGVHAEAHEYVLRSLALPYVSHPDYRPEWAPSAPFETC